MMTAVPASVVGQESKRMPADVVKAAWQEIVRSAPAVAVVVGAGGGVEVAATATMATTAEVAAP